MTVESRIQELITLKTIAETLNQSNDLVPMLNTVLDKLLELTGFAAAWIFLESGAGKLDFAAATRLPPALERADRSPMRCGTCWCLDRYDDGRLKNAVNILNCKRLEDAVEHQAGDTEGITHHATVPLGSGGRRFGLLNVADRGKERFEDKELALLQAVAYQIGGAIERMRLYETEQRRALLFERLGDYSRALAGEAGAAYGSAGFSARAVSLIGSHFDWPCAALLQQTGEGFAVRAVYTGGLATAPYPPLLEDSDGWLKASDTGNRLGILIGPEAAVWSGRIFGLDSSGQSAMAPLSLLAAPVAMSAKASGFLVVGTNRTGEDSRADLDVLEALVEHVASYYESVLLEENRRELARLEERNRLARDLHDSVSQMLFSLSMTAKGTESLLAGARHDDALLAVRDMQALSQSALKEMRTLIMQLRPPGLEAGLGAALSAYGRKLGLRVELLLDESAELPRSVEEALWRIGQEALNNVSKHAGTGMAQVRLQHTSHEARLQVADSGRGMASGSRASSTHPYGLSTMRERAEALGGRFELKSGPQGTDVAVSIPLVP